MPTPWKMALLFSGSEESTSTGGAGDFLMGLGIFLTATGTGDSIGTGSSSVAEDSTGTGSSSVSGGSTGIGSSSVSGDSTGTGGSIDSLWGEGSGGVSCALTAGLMATRAILGEGSTGWVCLVFLGFFDAMSKRAGCFKVWDLDFKIGRWLLIHRSLAKQLFQEASVSNGIITTMHFAN